MNDNGTHIQDDGEFESVSRYGTTLPEVKLHARISGPCFVLEIDGRKVEGQLSVDRMRVIGSSIDGLPRVAYTFEGQIDPLGVEQLAPLLTHRMTTGDVQFLSGILKATESFSAADWSSEALQGPSPAGIQSSVPPFEAFCRDPGVLSREFRSERIVEGEPAEKLEAQISGAGEFVEMRLLAQSDRGGGFWVISDYFKALLPSNPGRTANVSYSLATQLLESAAGEWYRRGSKGILEVLRDWNCEAVGRSEQRLLLEGSRGSASLVPDRSEIDISSVGIRLRYAISPESAVVSVESLRGIGFSRAEIRFIPHSRAKSLSASHLRCVIGLLRCIAEQRWEPRNEFEAYMLERLRSGLLRGGPHAADPMQLEISIDCDMTDPAVFLSQGSCKALAADTRCEDNSRGRPVSGVLLEVLRGAQVLTIGLCEGIARRRPELFSTLRLLERADGSLRIVASNGLGEEVTTTLLFPEDRHDEVRRATCDRLYEVFSSQELSDWSVLPRAMQTLAAEFGTHALVMKHVPAFDDSGARMSVSTGGRIAYLLARGGDIGMRCFLSTTRMGKVQLCASSVELNAAVDVVLDGAKVSELHFLYQPERQRDGFVTWSELGVLQRQPDSPGSEALAEIVSCLRSFFRDPHSAEAGVCAHPIDTVFRRIARRLAREGFVRTNSRMQT